MKVRQVALKNKEIIEGIVHKEWTESVFYNIALSQLQNGDWDDLQTHLEKYVGKQIRVTIEEIE